MNNSRIEKQNISGPSFLNNFFRSFLERFFSKTKYLTLKLYLRARYHHDLDMLYFESLMNLFERLVLSLSR